MGVVLRQAWSESQRTVLMGYLINKVKRYQTHHRWQFFLSGRQRTGALCVQHSPTAAAFEWNMWFSCFPVLPGSAEAQVTWGGIVKRLLIAYFIGNISAKNIKSIHVSIKVIASQGWDVSFRRADAVYNRRAHCNAHRQIAAFYVRNGVRRLNKYIRRRYVGLGRTLPDDLLKVAKFLKVTWPQIRYLFTLKVNSFEDWLS